MAKRLGLVHQIDLKIDNTVEVDWSTLAFNNGIIAEIRKLLEIDDESTLKVIKCVLHEGRKALVRYENIIIGEIYDEQMKENSELLQLLKKYHRQLWMSEYEVKFAWFRSLIEASESETYELYDRVLTRAAEYGDKYMNGCPLLSIVIQLLFESLSDDDMSTTSSDIWNSLTNHGLQSIALYSDYIVEEIKNKQLEKSSDKKLYGPLFMALREYYRDELLPILKKCKVLNRNNLYEQALDFVAEHGWINGIKMIERQTTRKNFDMLMESIKKMHGRSETLLSANGSVDTVVSKDHDTNQSVLNEKKEKSKAMICEDTASSRMAVIEAELIKNFNFGLLQLDNLLEAGELMYLNKTLKDIAENIVGQFNQKRDFPTFIKDCLTPIMYLLKRQQNLDDFFKILAHQYQRVHRKISNQSTETANITLRMLLHVLLMNSDILLRRTIMNLASKRNPVPFITPNIQDETSSTTHEYMSPIFHVWDSSRPTILSFGIGPCQGKSMLLNQLFQSTFEQSVQSIYFQQTIDIDFGYCFSPERSLNIADTHGRIDIKLLRKIQLLFDGFLIQIDETYFDQNPKIISNYMEVLSQDKFQMMILRDSQNQNSEACLLKIKNLIKQAESELSQKMHVYPLPNISNANDRHINFAIADLREEILKKIQEEIKVVNDKDELLANLQKLMKKDYVDRLKEMNKLIQPLKRCLLQENEYQRKQNFPLYLKFRDLCKTRQKLKKIDFYGSESENIFEINAKLFELESELDPDAKKLSPIECGCVFDLFVQVLKSKNMLMGLDLLASDLKYAISSLGGDKLGGDLSVENAFLSLEVLWRNSIVCYNHATSDTQALIRKSYHDFVAAGFPFETIDGDNFHFQHQFLTEIFTQFDSKQILIISIIGPQNSGKSTLLNYMFGTLFDVREGRCTRGIYGSFVKLEKSSPMIYNILKNNQHGETFNIDYIMLIDTEGLLSIGKGDKEYDRCLVLFSLAVSHLVIINMMGDINDTLRDILTLCADALKQIGVNTANQPINQ